MCSPMSECEKCYHGTVLVWRGYNPTQELCPDCYPSTEIEYSVTIIKLSDEIERLAAEVAELRKRAATGPDGGLMVELPPGLTTMGRGNLVDTLNGTGWTHTADAIESAQRIREAAIAAAEEASGE